VSDERTDTNVSSLSQSIDVGPPRQHPLPWMLFGVSCLALALIAGLLVRGKGMETKRANAEMQRAVMLETRLKQAESAKEDAEKRATAAEAEKTEAEKAVADLDEKVKKLEADKGTAVAAKAEDPAAAAKKAPPPKAKKKKKHR
jgi:hypothetical protein